MRVKQLLILGIVFLLSCSSARHGIISIELISYNYRWKPEKFELKCYLYAIIDKEGNATTYQWKTQSSNEVLYSRTVVEKSLIDSILVASERQMKYLGNNTDTISLYNGPYLKIKTNHSNGTFEVIDFQLENALFKYFESIYIEENLEPTYDTICFIKRKSELIDIAWKKDSSFFKGKMPHPYIPYE